MHAADVAYLPQPRFGQVETKLDRELGIYWGLMNPKGRPCFNTELLKDLSQFVDIIENSKGCLQDGLARPIKLNYGVIASRSDGVFSLGGDLELFRAAITRGERSTLVHYGRQCVDTLYRWWKNCNLPITTISLVQGEALGGGFECALASSVIVAEESARFGFPEVLFNLFPGMGAYSFLCRKVGRRIAEELITGGAIYSARQLYDMGVVDVITPTGGGEAGVYAFIRRHSKCANGRRGIEAAGREVQPLTHGELVRIVDLWADAALQLEERDIRIMDRLLRVQRRQCGPASSNVVSLEAVSAA